jgi:hypothetical protein
MGVCRIAAQRLQARRRERCWRGGASMRHQVMRREQTIRRPSRPRPASHRYPQATRDTLSGTLCRRPGQGVRALKRPGPRHGTQGLSPPSHVAWAPPCHRTVPGRCSAGGRAMSWGHTTRVFAWYGFCSHNQEQSDGAVWHRASRWRRGVRSCRLHCKCDFHASWCPAGVRVLSQTDVLEVKRKNRVSKNQ